MDKNLKRITGNDRLAKYVDSEYLGSGQLELDEDYVLTIDKLWQGRISTGGKAEQQIVISFKERTVNGVEVKPMILNATNRRTLKTLYGSDSAAALEGKQIIIYVETGVRDPRTGGTTEGLRIRARRPSPAKMQNMYARIVAIRYQASKVFPLHKSRRLRNADTVLPSALNVLQSARLLQKHLIRR